MKVYVVIRTPARGAIRPKSPVVGVVARKDEAKRFVEEKNTPIAKGRGIEYSWYEAELTREVKL